MFYVGTVFDTETNKQYKTQDRAQKAAESAGACVFDDTGAILYPLTETACADAEDAQETSNGRIRGIATAVFEGRLRVRNAPSFAPETECGTVKRGYVFRVCGKVISPEGLPMWETVDGLYVSADEAHTDFKAE